MQPLATDAVRSPPLPPVEMVELGGGRVCCVDARSGGAGGADGEPLVLLPGLVSTHRYYRGNVGALAERRRVLALDLPGFGRSDKPNADYGVPWYVERIRRFLDVKGIARAHFAGNSLGGQIALGLSLVSPERVGRLVLISPAGFVPWPAALMTLLDAAGRVAMNPSGLPRVPRVPRAALALLFRAAFPTRPDLAGRYADSYARGLESFEYPLLVRAAFRAMRGSLAAPMMREMRRVSAPTLIVWGQKDRILPPGPARSLKRALPDAKLLLYRDSGHCAMTDQPERFNADVARFLDGEPLGD